MGVRELTKMKFRLDFLDSTTHICNSIKWLVAGHIVTNYPFSFTINKIFQTSIIANATTNRISLY